MDPITMLVGGGLGLTLLGGLSKGKGEQQVYTAQADAANYQAQVADANMTLAGKYADAEIESGFKDEQKERIEGAQLIASQIVAQGASGLDVGSGSPARVRSSQKMINELDALTIRTNAEKRATGYRTQGLNYGAEANLMKMQESSIRKASKTAGTTSLLSTLGTVAGQASRFGMSSGFSFG